MYKIVGNRYIEKRVNIRVEHIKHSKCRQEFLDRVKRNHDLHAEAKAKGGTYLIYLLALSSFTSVCYPRACPAQAHPCSAPPCPRRLHRGQRATNYGPCTIRDHYLKCLPCHCRPSPSFSLCVCPVFFMLCTMQSNAMTRRVYNTVACQNILNLVDLEIPLPHDFPALCYVRVCLSPGRLSVDHGGAALTPPP